MKSHYSIRPMLAADLDQVFKVRTATVENAITLDKLKSYGITVASLTQALQAETKGWVCELNQLIVGFCMGNKNSAEMQVLAVLPEHEGHGLAKQLMNAVESWLFKQGHESIWLLTTPDPKLRAYGFYQHLAWVATGEIIDSEEKFTLSRTHFDQKSK